MPYKTGGETINERLARLRAELTTVRATIARALSNGQANTLNHQHVSEIAFERAEKREARLTAEITALERRRAGKAPNQGKAIIKSVGE